jgi:hypothetical protein
MASRKNAALTLLPDTIISIARARKILGPKFAYLTDRQIADMVNGFDQMALRIIRHGSKIKQKRVV